MATFERALRTLLQEVGRRILAWGLHPLEPECPAELPARLWLQGQASRRRRQPRTTLATLCGPVDVWRRRYAPLVSGSRAIHPWALRLGREASVAPPALAERLGLWAADHAQRPVLEMVRHDHGVPWSCTTLRQRLSRRSAGMAPDRQAAQVDRGGGGRHQPRASKGQWQPTLAVGRDGVNGPMRHKEGQEGAPAPVAVWQRRGKRVGTGYRGQMPEPGQPTLTAQWTALLQDIWRQVDAQGRRLVSGSDDGSHPSDYSHSGLQKRLDPQRPWRHLAWRRSVDSSHAGLSIPQWADALCGLGAGRGAPDAPGQENDIRWQHAGVTVGSGFAASGWLVR